MEEGYRRAEEMLKPTPYPTSFPQLPKLLAHQSLAAQMGEKFYRFNLDDIAFFDYPPAITKMREAIGDARIHVLAHCLGYA